MDLVVGRVVKAHGVRGELVVDVRTDDPADRFAVGTSLRTRHPRSGAQTYVTVTAARMHAGRLLLSLEGVDSRDRADELRGQLFVIDSADVDSGDDPDEFYDHELEGLPVLTLAGDRVGVVAEILHLPANDVLAVTAEDGRELLVPFVREIVPVIAADRIEIDPPDGLFD
ncbi:ribosome maturation factor RimM [Gordonia jinhuaensis]|uniref:Ribosome maturation factor RimM n=1 Tax=Gordonia jinhuaensis TaxID=1517702 RepID=A0A916T3Y8_9ACTN|nr:ribosome maturation factor RimM [Gordonia jinhuaensis]GGB30311.1 ribosome maturation factor RimM [Gordonia jinhuaensis]